MTARSSLTEKPSLRPKTGFRLLTFRKVAFYGVGAMAPKTVLGFDPGVSGGFAFWSEGALTLIPMPESEGDVVALLAGWPKPAIAYVEQLPMGHSAANVSSMAKLHGSGGFVRGVLAAFGWPVVSVPPKAWQTPLGLGTRVSVGKRWKAVLKEEARRRYPDVQGLTLKTSDALLILDFGLRRGVVPQDV